MKILKATDTGLMSLFLDSIIQSACMSEASDIHLDPGDEYVSIKFRVCGELKEVYRVSVDLKFELVGRIKILSKLRTDLQDRGQDGRFAYIYNTEKIDIRTSVVPTFYGESVVLRILRPEYQKNMSFETLGFEKVQAVILEKVLKAGKGMILVSGPTGSGKTTTMYSCIQYLADSGKSIVTIEDPIEYVMKGVRQIQIHDKHFTFVEGLRSVLRQDPEVIVIGEIRDRDTAELAFRASLTGHLVIASIHAGSIYGIKDRLLDLGISRNLLPLIALSIGQDLVPVRDAEGKTIRRIGSYELVERHA